MKNIFTLLFICTSMLYSQYKLIDYSETSNEIKLLIELESQNLLPQTKDIKKFNEAYFDLSKPGEYALPSKEIFIGIPSESKITIKESIIKSNRFKFNLGFNPKPVILDDSTTSFSFDDVEYKSQINKPVIEILGYLWIDKIYCAHVRINQYSYNDKIKTVNEIKTIRLNIKTNKTISSTTQSVNNLQAGSIISGKIINRNYAEKFREIRSTFALNDTTYQWINFSNAYLKLGTALDGVYRLSKLDLESYNISTSSIDPKTFKIYLKGKEIPIYVAGENDGIFNDHDYIEFFGERNMGGKHREVSEYNEPYNEYLGRYTDTTVYWLTWGTDPGKRVPVNTTFNLNADTLKYYNEIMHQEKNAWFDFSSADQIRREKPFWIENKTWGWGGFKGGQVRTYNFSLTDVFPDKPAKLFAKLQSYASQIFTNAHLLSLSLNSGDLLIDTVAINKYEKVVLEAEVNSNELSNGTNKLKAHSFLTSSSINLCFFDWAEIEYPRYLKTIDDSLNFQFPFLIQNTEKLLNITNVIVNQPVIWKKGENYEKYLVEKIGNEVFFSDTISSNDKFVLVKEEKIRKPKIYYSKNFVNLRNTANQAEYIAITHKRFLEKTREYASFIEDKYNINTAVIDVDDIYDEFSFGFFNPEVLRDFLYTAYWSWTEPQPKYVNLIGDATYDYHHNKETYLGLPRVDNYVPSFGAPVSDNWYVMWDTTGAYIPQMNIGRLPVKEADELDRYLQRHKNYVEQEYDDWNKNYLFFSGGQGDSQSELDLLSNANWFVINEYAKPAPIGGNINHFYKTVNPTTNFGPFELSYVQEAIDNGAVFISYIGHSGTRTWDNSITEPEHLNNKRNRSPLVTDYGCSTAKFAESDITSYSELFILSEESQGIGYIGNSSLGFTSTATYFPRLFYKKILSDTVFNISEALNQAKIELLQSSSSSKSYQLFSLTNTLIGDPIVSLPIPLKANLNIEVKDVIVNTVLLNDASDSVAVTIVYNNFGRVFNDSLLITIKDEFNGQVIYNKNLKRKIPNLHDTLLVNIPIKNKPGKHQLVITLDVENKIDEISENDNQIVFDIIVASSSTRTTLNYLVENTLDTSLIILNPSTQPLSENLIYEISPNKDFTQSSLFQEHIDTFFTKININSLENKKRFWLRTKLENESNYGVTNSFTKFPNSKFLINDSLSFSNSDKKNLTWQNYLTLDTSTITLSVSSAGFYDGRSALVFKNDTNYVPENYRTGHHIVLFNSNDFTFKEYKYFNTFSGGATVIEQYKEFLDSLSSNYLVFIGISDDGRIRDAELREKLYGIGSKYIDSLQFRSSWAIIGYKGAVQGSVPEAFSNPTEGPVKVDTSFQQQFKEGTFTTSIIGPAAKWKNLFVSDSITSNSIISYFPIGINEDETEDTLAQILPINNVANLSSIDANKYRYIKFLVKFNTADFNESPQLNSLSVNYTGLPELGTNYQVVSIAKDTLQQGEDAELTFYVYNVGESPADSFKVTVDIVLPDNSKERINEILVDSLGSEKRRKFNISYNTASFNGERTFAISIDSDGKILELYEDNNFYSIPFYVLGDTTKPTMTLTFDGNELFDGEYITNTPNIKVELSDPSLIPITDTSSVSIFLNNSYINYLGNEDILSINFSETNPKVVVEYTPTLEDGEYTLRVFGKDASGNIRDSSGITKTFNVMNEAKLLNVYNYPNPFSNETYFTFKLTQIPDEVRIKIFTIAGRLIKEIELSSSQLNYDLNKIYWDGKDEDGDLIGNGVYLYKVIMDVDGKKHDITQKLAIVR